MNVPELKAGLARLAEPVVPAADPYGRLLRRSRRVRVRRHLAVAVAAGLAATVLVGGVALLGPRHGEPRPEVAANPRATPRLFITGGGFSWVGTDGRQVGLSPTDDLGEVLPDGRLVTRRIPGLPAVVQAVTLPEGGFVALGWRTPTEPQSFAPPGASPTRASASGAMSVAVVRPDGSVRWLADTAASVLLGADDRRVYLGGAGIIALDLATGRQQSLVWPDLHADAVLASGRFAQLTGEPPGALPQTCVLELLDANTGAQSATRSLAPDDCWRDGTALSPDGRWLAIAQPGPFMGGNINELRLILLDVDTGEQTNQVLDQGPAVGNSGNVTFQGMTWLNDDGVRVVWTHLPDHVDQLYDRSEVLRMTTVTVPAQ